jgi:hypothetical protein
MKEELINKILDSLYEGTKDGAVTWSLRKTIFNSETCHNMSTISTDGETEFQIEIHLDDTLNHKIGSNLYIRNKKILDGYASASSYKNNTLKELEKLIFEKFIKPTLKPRSNDEYVLEDILNSIGSKEYMRDKKLEQILGEDKEETKTEKKKNWRLW